MKQSLRLVPRSFAATVALVASACAAPDIAEVVQPPTVTGAVGQQVVIDFRTIGDGPQWDSIPVVTAPPLVSSPAVRFVSSIPDAPPYNPGGPTQRFTFLALVHGYVTVTFTHGVTADSKTYMIEVP
jgi:hypothetical protein